MVERTASKDGTIQKRVLVRASPGTVFLALTQPDQLSEWFCERADVDARVGGSVVALWRHGRQECEGRALFRRLEPSSLVELEWTDEGMGQAGIHQRHTLTYTIRSRKDGCEVIMCDEGAPLPDPEAMKDLEEGWISVLRDLKEHCESLARAARPRNARRVSA